MPGTPRIWVGGLPFVATSISDATTWLLETAARDHLPVNVRLANAYNVALADSDPSYHDLMRDRGINFPDGTPVVWAMRMRSRKAGVRPGRVRGPSLFVDALERSASLGTQHFLLGSTPDTLAKLQTEIASRYPGVTIAGSYSPPFAAIDDDYIADCATRVREVDADVVWMGLGTPKQDVLGTALADAVGRTTVNVGAAFDYVAGTVREAPPWIQRSGFEWLYRLLAEPRRLWKRYLIGNIRFLIAVVHNGKTQNA